MKENIIDGISQIRSRIHDACIQSDRSDKEVKLLLATKTVSIENIRYALAAGETLIGENKIQELKAKHDALTLYNPEFHVIGHLQTNKIKDVLQYATCIQSVDRLDLAQKLDQRLLFEGKAIDVLIQINTSYEESKFGMHPENAVSFVREVSQYKTLRIKGLMTIGLLSSEKEKVRKCFRLLKQLQQEIIAEQIPNVEMDILSMGMSGDLETAIEEGSTMIRVGTAIFGNRMYPDSYYWDENLDVK